MDFIDTVLAKTRLEPKPSADEILNNIGRNLPKKLRKKLRWKKIQPVLRVLIAVLLHLAGTHSGQRGPRSGSAAEKGAPSARPERQPTTARNFSDDALQAYVARAEAYQAEIDRLARKSGDGDSTGRVQELARHMQAWTASITSLAQRIEDFRQNKLISKDLKEVPRSIASLEARLSQETDPLVSVELERTVTNRRQQLVALEKLQRSIQMAEIKIESTLSMLGTIYSQILAGRSTRQVADYRRLLNEIDEEVHTLQDHLEALEEVKLART